MRLRDSKGGNTDKKPKEFSEKDVEGLGSDYPRIYLDRSDLIDAPMRWHRQGLQQTASGYGGKLTTSHKIRYCGRAYRLYATCCGNASSVWFTAKGKRIYVS